jgi:CheY-like chemotaxis protein
MNGLEATARIRQHPDPARAATPVLAMTADAFSAQHERYRAASMDDVLTKPFTESELLAKLLAVGTRQASGPHRPA